MKHHNESPVKRRQQTPGRSEPLNDQRFQDLIGRASVFFATAEREMKADKAAAIAEIQARMLEYGLTVDDLRDTKDFNT